MKREYMYQKNKGNVSRKIILYLLARSSIGRTRIGATVLHTLLTVVVNTKVKRKEIVKYATHFRNQGYKNLWFDSISACFKYGITLDAYYLFGFYKQNQQERATWIGDNLRYCLSESNNDLKSREITSDKWNFYQNYREFMQREIMPLCNSDDLDSVYNWCLKQGDFIVKPRYGTGGYGIEKYSISSKGKDLRRYLSQKLERGEFVIEEIIKQHPEMAKFNPGSVNSIRIMTITKDDGGIDIVGAYLRMGNGGFIDNFTSGGIIAPIDVKTGVVNGKAITKDVIGQTEHEYHPGSGTKILGFEVPYWRETLDMLNKLVTVYPQMRSCGWDIAITEQGPTVIEGNRTWGVLMYQMTQNKGMLPTILPYIKKHMLLPVHRKMLKQS